MIHFQWGTFTNRVDVYPLESDSLKFYVYNSVFHQKLYTDQVLYRRLVHAFCVLIAVFFICRNGCPDGRSGRKTEAGQTARKNTQQKHETVKEWCKVKVI